MSAPYYEIKLNYEFLSSSDNPNGILSPVVTKEINTSGSFSFTVTPECSRYSEIKRWVSYIDVEIRGKNVFRGRVLEISSDFFNQLNVTCEGALSYLNDFYCRVNTSFSYMYRDLARIMMDDTLWMTYQAQAVQETVQGKHPKMLSLFDSIGTGHGLIEPDYDGGNMVSYESMIEGQIDHSTGEVIERTSQSNRYYVCKDFIATENGTNYTFAPTDYYVRDADVAYKVYIAEYTGTPANPVFQRMVTHTTWNAWYAGTGRLIRFYSLSKNMWLASQSDVTTESEDDKQKIVKFFDYISQRYLDKRGMMIRAQVRNDRTFLQFLHPKRNWNPKKFSITENIINLSSTNPSSENIYSVLLATFNGEVYRSASVVNEITYEIPGAVEKFGVIYHTVDFNEEPFDPTEQTSKKNAILKKLKQYADIYNPILPDTITITGIDPDFFDENGELIDVGDSVTVESAPNNISLTKLCLSIKLDLQAPQNNEYKVGAFVKDGEDNRIKTLTESFVKSKKAKK